MRISDWSSDVCSSDRLPSIVSFGIALPLLRRRSGLLVLADAALHLRAAMAPQALDRPGRGVAERAVGMDLDLIGHIEQRVTPLALVIAANQPDRNSVGAGTGVSIRNVRGRRSIS